jgi:hypothetical protein
MILRETQESDELIENERGIREPWRKQGPKAGYHEKARHIVLITLPPNPRHILQVLLSCGAKESLFCTGLLMPEVDTN